MLARAPRPCALRNLQAPLSTTTHRTISSTNRNARPGDDAPSSSSSSSQPYSRPRAPRPPPSSSTSSLLSLHDTERLPRTSTSTSAHAASASRLGRPAQMMERYRRSSAEMMKSKEETLERLRNMKNSSDYLRQMPRRWDAGDVYSPHDLSPVEMQKWRKRSPRGADVVDALGIRPLDMYKNFSLIQEFTTTSGQIKHSSGTSLRPVNQRKIAKMIRRVQGMGLYPTIHDHPEMIRDNFFPERRS